MANKWLKSQKTQDTHDIRRFIPVFGKILKTDNPSTVEAPETKNFKQSSITDFNFYRGSNKVTDSQSRPEKAPASTFTTGVRKRIRMVVCSEDEETNTETRHSTHTQPNTEINKENVGSTCQKSPCHSLQKSCDHLHSKRDRRGSTCLLTKVQPSPQEHRSSPFLPKRRKNITQDKCSYHPNEHLNDIDKSPLSKKHKVFTDSKLETDDLELVNGVSPTTVDPLHALDTDSEVYIDTNELLADLSNCEKMIISDHEHN